MKERELQGYMQENGIDYSLLFFFANSRLRTNFFYFSQHLGEGCYVIPQSGKGHLALSPLESGKKTAGNIFESINKEFGRKAVVGVDKDNLTYAGLRQIRKNMPQRLFNISDKCNELRATKTEPEIEMIRKACKISEEIVGECINRFTRFRSERDAQKFLKIRAIEHDCEPSFTPIVASGKNAAIPHHNTNGKISKGFCIIDFGIRHKGYCSDITRTVYVGKAKENERRIFQNSLGTEMECIENIKEGAQCEAIHSIAQKKLGKLLIHATGHGVGIDVHEKPTISEGNKERLRENMVLAIEPGSYALGKYGIRTEDMVVVGKDRAIIISKPQGFIQI